MKKFLMLLFLPMISFAENIENAIPVIQKMGLQLIKSQSNKDQLYIGDKSCTQSECREVLTISREKDTTDIMRPGPFGDFPVTINRRAGIFYLPTVTDRGAHIRDYLMIKGNDGYLYVISYGYQGEKFNDIVKITKAILQ